MLSKVKSNAKWNALSAHNRKLLEEWLFEEAISYKDALQRAKDQFQFTGSLSSIRRFYARTARERSLAALTDAATHAQSINDSKIETAALKDASLKMVAQLLLTKVTESPDKPGEWAMLARLLLRDEANRQHARLQTERNEIRRATLAFARERSDFNLVEKALKKFPEINRLYHALDANAGRYETNGLRNRFLSSLLGRLPDGRFPESAEEETEQIRELKEWEASGRNFKRKYCLPQTDGLGNPLAHRPQPPTPMPTESPSPLQEAA